jgi:hypothetical protein
MAEDKAEEKGPVDPKTYFNKLKSKKQKCTDEVLNGIYTNCMTLMEKYQLTGQIDAMKKLLFHLETIERERKVLASGIDIFVYLDDIKQYINDVGDKVVKIIELDRYEREIPDEVVAKYVKVKDLFDRFIIVFTDYTKQYVDKTQKSRKERDPILFGLFQDKKSERRDTVTSERCYFIGDWEDEFCDLTLEKLVAEMRPDLKAAGEPTVFQLYDPVNIEELRAKIKAIEEEKNRGRVSSLTGTMFTVSSNLTNSKSYVVSNVVADQNLAAMEEPTSAAPVKKNIFQKFFKR